MVALEYLNTSVKNYTGCSNRRKQALSRNCMTGFEVLVDISNGLEEVFLPLG